MNVGILGAGNIAGVMANTIAKMDGVHVQAIASRDEEKAKKFAEEFQIAEWYGTYEELLQQENIELVYIATPHSHHAEHMKLCIAHKKPILCEKAFTATAAQAREVLEYAKEQKVFVAEAIWTRYMPSRNIIKETMESGIIGEIHSLTANLGYSIDHVERMQEPALAGGALLDLGVYPINFAVMCFGEEIESITSTAILTEKGVDKSNSITLCYKNGQMAVLHSNFYVTTDRRGIIYGNKGFIEVTNINNCEKIEVFDVNRNKIKEMEIPAQISGFEYEVLACKRALQEGKLECAEMPHQDSIFIMEIMDSLRKEWGVRFPFEA